MCQHKCFISFQCWNSIEHFSTSGSCSPYISLYRSSLLWCPSILHVEQLRWWRLFLYFFVNRAFNTVLYVAFTFNLFSNSLRDHCNRSVSRWNVVPFPFQLPLVAWCRRAGSFDYSAGYSLFTIAVCLVLCVCVCVCVCVFVPLLSARNFARICRQALVV